jgi:folate-dependent phosphoribosylglycinamide formyltransferase PurN
MTTKLRTAVLCSGDSSALECLVELLPELPISLELLVTNKRDGNNLFLNKVYDIDTSYYDNKSPIGAKNFENSLLEELKESNIEILIILGFDYIIQCSEILDHFEDKILFLSSPLFEYQLNSSSIQTVHNCLKNIFGSTSVNLILYESRDNLVRTSIPIFPGIDNLDSLSHRLRVTEKLVLKAGIELANECFWKK